MVSGLASDRSSFTIEGRFKPSGANDKLTIKGYTAGMGYSCKYVNSDVKDLTITDPEFALNCVPTSDSELKVSISTDHSLIGPFTIPRQMPFDAKTEIDTLKAELATVTGRLDEANQAISKASEAISTLGSTTLSVRSIGPVSAGANAYGNWGLAGECAPGEFLIQYYCQVDSGNGHVQNFGSSDVSHFHCLWSGTSADFSAHGTGICMKSKLVN